MSKITIPKNIAGKDDLIVMPRKEYEALLGLTEKKEFIPTHAQKKALARAENNFRKGKALTYEELVKKLGFAD